MKRRIYKTLIFLACDYLSITKIVKEGLNIFTYAYVTLLLQIKRKNPYIYQAKVKKCIFDGLSQFVTKKVASQKFNAPQ